MMNLSWRKKLDIETCQKSIDSYCDILKSTRFTKSVIIRGHRGVGRKKIMLYDTLHAISKGLNVITTAQMDKISHLIVESSYKP